MMCIYYDMKSIHYFPLLVPQVHILEPMEVGAGEGEQVKLCVAVSGSLQEDVKIQVETGDDGSALGENHLWFILTCNGIQPLLTANFDYVLLNSTLTFGPLHSVQQCVQIEIVDDSLAEGLEQFTVGLTTTSSAVNVTDSIFKIFIEPNDCRCKHLHVCL